MGGNSKSVLMGDRIDDAFDWLILIIGTMNGALIGLPEGLEAKKAMAGGVILPFLVLVIVWLLSARAKPLFSLT
ncbi:MAG: hypothetical protein ACUVQY_11220 [Thermoproteota archaeon]